MRKLFAGLALALLVAAAPAQAQTYGDAPSLQNGLTTTVKTVKGTQGALDWFACANTNAAVAFVQVFDAASVTSVTLGTTVPAAILPVGSSSVHSSRLGAEGMRFVNGIKVAATTTATGSTAPTTPLDCTFGVK